MSREESRGMVLVYTGKGKGKTTAALGTAFRALGYDRHVCMIQFIKGTWKYGEMETVKVFGEKFELHRMGRGFYKICDDNLSEEEHRKAAGEGIALAESKMVSGDYHLIILDEILYAIKSGLLNEDRVIDLIDKKPDEVDLILTGRGASKRIIGRADLVTEMKEIKHPFRSGITARKGIDF